MSDEQGSEANGATAVVDAEVVEEAPPVSQALEIAHRPEGSTALIAAATAAEKVQIAAEIATQLDAVIRAQGLRTKIGRRKKVDENGVERWEDAYHVNVEGWQTLATFLDLAVVPQPTRQVIDPETGRAKLTDYEIERFFYERGATRNTIKNGTAKVERVEKATVAGYDWEARCEIYKDGTLIAAADAMVSRAEETWRSRDDHALRSMAQTRAMGKAIAGAARWIVALAGYSTTPAEEMDGVAREQQQAADDSDRPPPVRRPTANAGSGGSTPATVAQRKLIFAKAKEAGLEEEQLKAIFVAVAGDPHSDRIPKDKVDEVLAEIEKAARKVAGDA